VSLDKSGKAEKVILGVGGFFGMGEHYVAVPFEKIKWVNEPVPSTTASKSTASADKPAANVIATLVRLPTAPPKLRPGPRRRPAMQTKIGILIMPFTTRPKTN
jgi:hypothetical protein